MYKLFFNLPATLALLSALLACVKDSDSEVQQRVLVENGLTANETVFVNSGYTSIGPFDEYMGEFDDGTNYVISKYSDGSVGEKFTDGLSKSQILERKLNISCNIGRMDDKLVCTTDTHFVSDRFSNISNYAALQLTSKGFNFPHKVCIREHDHPGEIAKIRFDSDRPISLGEDGCSYSPKVINKIFSSEIIKTEYANWPYVGNAHGMRVSHTRYYRDVLKRMKEIFHQN